MRRTRKIGLDVHSECDSESDFLLNYCMNKKSQKKKKTDDLYKYIKGFEERHKSSCLFYLFVIFFPFSTGSWFSFSKIMYYLLQERLRESR